MLRLEQREMQLTFIDLGNPLSAYQWIVTSQNTNYTNETVHNLGPG